MEEKGRGRRGWSCSELEERSVQSEMEAGEVIETEVERRLQVCYWSHFQAPLSFPLLVLEESLGTSTALVWKWLGTVLPTHLY